MRTLVPKVVRMEKVFSLEGAGLSHGHSIHGMGSRNRSGVGVVEKVLGPGRFRVGLDGGEKVEVAGPRSLKAGQQVKVFFEDAGRPSKGILDQENPGVSKDQVSQWTAMIPLGFGGKGAKAKLEVFSDRRQGKVIGKESAPVYFVFTVVTKLNGLVQWSVHVRGRQVSIQVHSTGSDRTKLKDLIRKIESGLETKGFSLSGPAVILGHPFRRPTGPGLNVTG